MKEDWKECERIPHPNHSNTSTDLHWLLDQSCGRHHIQIFPWENLNPVTEMSVAALVTSQVWSSPTVCTGQFSSTICLAWRPEFPLELLLPIFQSDQHVYIHNSTIQKSLLLDKCRDNPSFFTHRGLLNMEVVFKSSKDLSFTVHYIAVTSDLGSSR